MYITSAGESSGLEVQYWEPGQLLTRHYTAPWHQRSVRVGDVITTVNAYGDYGDVALSVAGLETAAARMGVNVPSCELAASNTWISSHGAND